MLTNNSPLRKLSKLRKKKNLSKIWDHSKKLRMIKDLKSLRFARSRDFGKGIYTVDKSSQVQPILIGIIFPDGFSWLQQVLNLRFIQVWIAIIYYIIQELAAFPDAHNSLVKLPILFSHPHHLDQLIHLHDVKSKPCMLYLLPLVVLLVFKNLLT